MWDVGLAKMLKERDNASHIGNCIGNVVGLDPLKISILDGDIILQGEQLYIAYDISLERYDDVLLVPAENEQIFFIVNKMQKVGG